jgi:diacylglycerol kinase family enzyme
MRRVAILNATAGTIASYGADVGAARVRAALAAAGLDCAVETVGPAELAARVRSARDRGAEAVIVGGGDGSLNTAAGLLAGSGTALGVLPLGTFNHFAKDLGIPLDLAGAVRALAGARTGPRDIAEVNGRIFINHSAIGLYPRMLRHRDLQRARFGRSKWLATAVASAAALRDYPTFGLRIRIGAEAMVRRSPFVFVGNNGYILDSYGIAVGGGRQKLALVVAHDVGRLGLLRMGLGAFAGRLELAHGADALTFASAVIESRRRHLRVEIDGEVAILAPPLRYRLLPGALSVLQPQPEAELSPPDDVDLGGGRERWTGTGSAAAGSA